MHVRTHIFNGLYAKYPTEVLQVLTHYRVLLSENWSLSHCETHKLVLVFANKFGLVGHIVTHLIVESSL